MLLNPTSRSSPCSTNGQPFTPPLAVTHRQSLSVFEVGEAASLGVKEIAENGNLAPLQGELGGHKHVADLVIALGAPPPILPGTSRSFTINSDTGPNTSHSCPC